MRSRAEGDQGGYRRRRQRLAFGLALLVAISFTSFASIAPSSASENGDSGNFGDHDRARQALAAGEILPLKTVLERLAREMPGEVMEVELERRGERWIYEIKLLRPGGSLVKLRVDARDGAIIANREKGAKR